MAQIDLGVRLDGSRDRRSRSFSTRRDAEDWLIEVRTHAEELTAGVADQRLADYLRWWIEHEAPKGNGRVDGGTTAEVEDEMFRVWQRDVLTPGLDGQHPTVLMIVRTNDQAATMSERARWVRLRAGLVDPGPTVQLHDNVASRGDQIVTRRNDRRLQTDGDGWVVNGDVWTVAAVHRDGSASAVRTRDGDRVRLPHQYLAAHTHLAYATTAHRAQGMTVDRCHAFIDGSEAHHLLYGAATRGRESNHLWVGLELPRRDVLPGSPINVLLAILQREDDRRRSATAIRDEPGATLGGWSADDSTPRSAPSNPAGLPRTPTPQSFSMNKGMRTQLVRVVARRSGVARGARAEVP